MKPISPPIIIRPASETMDAFDALPGEIRQAVSRSPLAFDVVDILNRWKSGTNQSKIVQRMARQAAAVERLRR
jgi:hypothetical protein